MITTNIMGGLGNQLFQIFNVISYAIDNNCQFVFPSQKILYADENTTLRYTYWDTLLYELQSFLKEEKDIYYNIKLYEKDDSSYTKFLPVDKLLNHIKENNKFSLTSSFVYFTGYFQSYKYFQHNYDKIVNMLDFNKKKEEIIEYVSKEYDLRYFLKNSISLHFRIGDFVKYTDSHIILPDQYYVDAITTIIDKLDVDDMDREYNIIYFCEKQDINIVCKRIENILKLLGQRNIYNCTFMSSPLILKDWQEMLFMSMCDHNIMANSSFSWWGAYLNNNPNKIVCYSSIYYSKNYNKNVLDLFPENWIKIHTSYVS